MIKPTIGRQVWYWKVASQPGDQPEAATIAYVWGDQLVNLQVIDRYGVARSEMSVHLTQDENFSAFMPFCEWMPYQKGQAAKTEQLERAAGAQVGVS